ncbi:MAG: hypothetical protein ACFFB3_11335 [Candidatus Hodarchaeota archaeon]
MRPQDHQRGSAAADLVAGADICRTDRKGDASGYLGAAADDRRDRGLSVGDAAGAELRLRIAAGPHGAETTRDPVLRKDRDTQPRRRGSIESLEKLLQLLLLPLYF